MVKKVLRSGNSLAVTIPAGFAKDLGVKPGDNVEVTIDKSHNRLSVKFAGSTQLSLSPQLLKKSKIV